MKDSTRAAVAALIATDDTIKDDAANAALRILDGRKADGAAVDTPITRRDAAKMLNVSPVTVTAWGRAGIIRRLSVKGRRRAFGYSLKSINAVLSGKRTGAAA